MNIATQGGKIITKDGKLGTDCACCGGWYCYYTAECGCCCLNGSETTLTEEQCTIAGGTWKNTSCVSPAPTAILLTLSLTNYSQFLPRSPTTTSAGTWDFDFSCVSSSYTLNRTDNPYLYSSSNGSVVASIGVFPSGTISGGDTTCGCAVPVFSSGVVYGIESAVSTRSGYSLASQINCNAGIADAGNSWQFELLPSGVSYNTFPRVVSVPGFCGGPYTVTGTVYGPGEVQCGTFTLANP